MSCTVTPWSVTATGCPLAVTDPTTTCELAVAVPFVAVAMVSTTTFETRTSPITKLWTSECVVTVSVPSELTTVSLWPDAPLNGCVPPPE